MTKRLSQHLCLVSFFFKVSLVGGIRNNEHRNHSRVSRILTESSKTLWQNQLASIRRTPYHTDWRLFQVCIEVRNKELERIFLLTRPRTLTQLEC